MLIKLLTFEENVPVPVVDHCPPVEIVTDPDKFTVELFAQTDWSIPAFAVGAGEKLTCRISIAKLHELVAVKARVTLPVVVSAVLGMYKAFKVVEFGLKVPLPEVAQIP